jgi:hypothetical protein
VGLKSLKSLNLTNGYPNNNKNNNKSNKNNKVKSKPLELRSQLKKLDSSKPRETNKHSSVSHKFYVHHEVTGSGELQSLRLSTTTVGDTFI